MNYRDIYNKIVKKNSFLCVGLDTDLEKIPQFLLKEEDPIFEFNKQIIDATQQYAVGDVVFKVSFKDDDNPGGSLSKKPLNTLRKIIRVFF